MEGKVSLVLKLTFAYCSTYYLFYVFMVQCKQDGKSKAFIVEMTTGYVM
jgi:hypothetical protein